MGTYYGRYSGGKTYHVIHADNVAQARSKMQKGTRYNLNEIIIKTKRPNTKYPIAGR